MKHLKENNMGYFVHMGRAIKFALFAILCSFKATIHGIFPCCFQGTSDDLMEYIIGLDP